MAKKKQDPIPTTADPILKTASAMSKLCGIGENRLRDLMDQGELEYLQVGSHRLLMLSAILDYYERHKTSVRTCSAAAPSPLVAYPAS
ncbi:MAG: DNA-binding protein [Alphaproteobacteria bacterium]|nr:DNA-binding protein [Alphaproteobacteria bacterium]